MAVVARSRCRSTWLTSTMLAPRRSICVASVWRSRRAPARGSPARSQAWWVTSLTRPGGIALIGALAARNTCRSGLAGRACDRWHGGSHRPWRQATQIQESEQRAQLAHAALDRAGAEPLAFSQQEGDNICAGQTVHAAPGQTLAQKRARKLHIAHYRGLSQSP